MDRVAHHGRYGALIFEFGLERPLIAVGLAKLHS
jgi:hypothetical protein